MEVKVLMEFDEKLGLVGGFTHGGGGDEAGMGGGNVETVHDLLEFAERGDGAVHGGRRNDCGGGCSGI